MRKKNGIQSSPILIVGMVGTSKTTLLDIFRSYGDKFKNGDLELAPTLIHITGKDNPIEVSGILLPKNAPPFFPKSKVTDFDKLINRKTIKEIVDNPAKLSKCHLGILRNWWGRFIEGMVLRSQ